MLLVSKLKKKVYFIFKYKIILIKLARRYLYLLINGESIFNNLFEEKDIPMINILACLIFQQKNVKTFKSNYMEYKTLFDTNDVY